MHTWNKWKLNVQRQSVKKTTNFNSTFLIPPMTGFNSKTKIKNSLKQISQLSKRNFLKPLTRRTPIQCTGTDTTYGHGYGYNPYSGYLRSYGGHYGGFGLSYGGHHSSKHTTSKHHDGHEEDG